MKIETTRLIFYIKKNNKGTLGQNDVYIEAARKICNLSARLLEEIDLFGKNDWQ
jgi:hypothetical protein